MYVLSAFAHQKQPVVDEFSAGVQFIIGLLGSETYISLPAPLLPSILITYATLDSASEPY